MKNKICIVLGVIGVVLGVVSFFVLPDTVAVQFNSKGEITNTLPKLPAILIPLIFSAAGAVIGIKGEEATKIKGLVLAGIGVLIQIFTLFLNR